MQKHFYQLVLVTFLTSNMVVACIPSTPTSTPPSNVPSAPASTVAPQEANTATQTQIEIPRFSKPTEITNPFYPVARIGHTISLGQEGGQIAREEVTVLPISQTITWNGESIPVLVSQFVAYSDDTLAEVAYDYFAQGDDGGVYYFGEEVSNYEDGQLVNHEGSWMAGKDGAPPALIMPAQPKIGMSFNPENFPGVVFESDEILSLNEKTSTPDGPTDQGLLIKETLMDGSIEYKLNVANYGIVEARADDEKVNLVLFRPADAQPREIPSPLVTIEAEAEDLMDFVPAQDWEHIAKNIAAIQTAWQAYQAQASQDGVPQPFQDNLQTAFAELQKSATAKNAEETAQTANDLSAALMDIFAAYHPAEPVDLGRLDVLGREVVMDTQANDLIAVADTLAKTNAIWARLKPTVLARNGADVAAQFEASLATQTDALSKKDTDALITEANNGLELVDALEQLF